MFRIYATPLRVEVNASVYYLAYVLVVVGLAVMAVSILDLSLWFRLLLISTIILFSILSCLQNLRPKTVIWQSDNKWLLIDKRNRPASVMQDSVVLPWLLILNFKLESGGIKSLIIFRDSTHSECFRKLSVRLKVSAAKLFKQDQDHMLN